jgi:hypothetical protein
LKSRKALIYKGELAILKTIEVLQVVGFGGHDFQFLLLIPSSGYPGLAHGNASGPVYVIKQAQVIIEGG